MPEPLAGYLRIRLVDPRVTTTWSENFDSPGTSAATLFHSLGTEAGTDNSINYWTVAAGSAWTFASHIATGPNATDNILSAGHPDWLNTNLGITFEARMSTSAASAGIMICVQANGDGYLWQDGGTNTFNLFKRVSGVYTQIGANKSFTFTQGNPIWVKLSISGTTITAYAALDNSGAPGTYTGFTFTDSTYTTGKVALRNTTAGAFGGAFNNVCQVTGTAPNFWTPVITSGEPAFAISTASPQAGTYSASISLANSGGNGAWRQTTTLPASASTKLYQLSSYIKTSAGTANVSAGGQTTPNAPTTGTWAQETVTGASSANPTVSCNYSGAVGSAYFDTQTIVSQGQEITSDLPHLHQATLALAAMQSGNPSNSTLGSGSIQLHPPGSDGYSAARSTYDKLDYGQRVELYLAYSPTGATLGNLKFAGIITGIHKTFGDNSVFELSINPDYVLANRSRPFPGELLPSDVTSAVLKSYLGTNEVGASDNFNPFTGANYTSTSTPSNSAGTWTGTTDDGFNVVSANSGTGAVLISKQGLDPGDRWNTYYVEVTGRLKPSTDSTNAGQVGIGLSQSNSSVNDAILGYVVIRQASGSRYTLDAYHVGYSAGSASFTPAFINALTNVDDPQGYVPLTIGLLFTQSGNSSATQTVSVIVNGRVCIGQWATTYATGGRQYPWLFFAQPASGSATCYLTNLVGMTRFSNDGPSSASTFIPGSVTTSTASLGFGVDLGPNLLDTWTRLATRTGWYWRYTPKAYTPTTRTLGTVDFGPDPGTDRTNSVIFARHNGNLLNTTITANADQWASDTATSGQPTVDGAGIAYTRDIPSLQKWGAIQDESLALTHSDFNGLRRAAIQILSNKVAVNLQGSKTVEVLRDQSTADKWRELDRVTLDDPEMGLNKLSARILGYTFEEGIGTQTLTLDQFQD